MSMVSPSTQTRRRMSSAGVVIIAFAASCAEPSAEKPRTDKSTNPVLASAFASFVPQGWVAWDSALGDLNRDGRTDVALVIVKTSAPDDARSGLCRDREQEMSGRALLVLLANDDGSYAQRVRSDGALPIGSHAQMFRRFHNDVEDPYDTLRIDAGCIDIWFSNVGSGGRSWKYRYRFQGDDFYLIGATHGNGYNGATSSYDEHDYNLNTGVLLIDNKEYDSTSDSVPRVARSAKKVKKLAHLPRLQEFRPGQLDVLGEITF